jgi:peptidoglycan pentaglycine glycine transferase (the first glycine)
MELFSTEKLAEYEGFVSSHPKGHFMQSYYWSLVKKEWKFEAIIKRDTKGKIIGTLAVLIRKVPGLPYTLMYCPRGPVCDVHNEVLFKALFDDAKALAKIYKSYLIKLDPDIKASDEQFAKMIATMGFKVKNDAKGFENIQPRFVFRLDVKDKTEEEMLAFFHSKTRYNIKVALKNNVEVKLSDKSALADFVKIMKVTGERDNFITRPLSYFEKMADALGDQFRLYMAYLDGKPIAGTIAILYGDKVWYLYGASSNEYRNVMPNYLLQFEMIKWALEEKCSIYDFRGISGLIEESNPLYGLYRFKKGFNGEFTEFIGELDFICKPLVYFAVEKGQKSFKKLRKIAFKLKK